MTGQDADLGDAVLVLRCIRDAMECGSAEFSEVRDLLVFNGLTAARAERAIRDAVADGYVGAACP